MQTLFMLHHSRAVILYVDCLIALLPQQTVISRVAFIAWEQIYEEYCGEFARPYTLSHSTTYIHKLNLACLRRNCAAIMGQYFDISEARRKT